MNVWTFLDRAAARLPGWPSERQWVTSATFGLVLVLLAMAHANPRLWDVEVFKVIIQAAVLTGLLNMILAFHFSANKGDEAKSANTGKAFDAIVATAQAGGASDGGAIHDGDQVTVEKTGAGEAGK